MDFENKNYRFAKKVFMRFLILISVFLNINSFSQDTRLWSTYYGGFYAELGYSVATDALGNVYLAGITRSSQGIASGGFQNSFGGGNQDWFLVKFDASGNRLWATYYGGAGDEFECSLAIDVVGNVYIAGQTSSQTGIASGGFQNAFAGGATDAFLVKFDPSGTCLWATYYGGSAIEYGYGIATDVLGNVYLSGKTESVTNIASGGFQNTYGGNADCFLVKFDGLGNRLWASYYGGTSAEKGGSVTTDALGNVYLGGTTNSLAAIASGGFQNTSLGGDAFLVKFDAFGNRQWATYYGGAGSDEGNSLATDAFGNVFLAGITSSNANIASGGFQNTYNVGTYYNDAFLVKFNASGNRLWATYYGGDGNIVPNFGDEEILLDGLATDAAGNVYLAGDTYSTNAGNKIASSGFQNSLVGDENLFLVKFSPMVVVSVLVIMGPLMKNMDVLLWIILEMCISGGTPQVLQISLQVDFKTLMAEIMMPSL